jgi:hypothetical protein
MAMKKLFFSIFFISLTARAMESMDVDSNTKAADTLIPNFEKIDAWVKQYQGLPHDKDRVQIMTLILGYKKVWKWSLDLTKMPDNLYASTMLKYRKQLEEINTQAEKSSEPVKKLFETFQSLALKSLPEDKNNTPSKEEYGKALVYPLTVAGCCIIQAKATPEHSQEVTQDLVVHKMLTKIEETSNPRLHELIAKIRKKELFLPI